MKRPKLDKNLSISDFRDYYWLKEELIRFCKMSGIDYAGSKEELAERIFIYLKTGEVVKKSKENTLQKNSSFNWKKEKLALSTIITDNYINSENVRNFFKQEIGNHFRFNTEFMQWMKHNAGKSLADAVEEWQRIYTEKRDKINKEDIPRQFEYNRYVRDFISDNPDMHLEDAIKHWNMKKVSKGSREYNSLDLQFE